MGTSKHRYTVHALIAPRIAAEQGCGEGHSGIASTGSWWAGEEPSMSHILRLILTILCSGCRLAKNRYRLVLVNK
jgi:hypothetical protein